MRSASALLVVLVLIVTAFAADLAAPLSLTVLKAEVGADMATGMPVLTITLDPGSTEKFAAFTAANVGKRTIVSIDGEKIMDPIIREPITQGVVQVSGEWTAEDLQRIAARLTGGATIDVEVVEEQAPAQPVDPAAP